MLSQEHDAMNIRIEYAALIVVVVLVLSFFLVFYVLPNYQEKAYDVDGLKIYSTGQPKAVMKTILAPENVLIELQLDSTNSSKNTGVQIMSAEIAAALAHQGKNVKSYGIVNGKPTIDCVKDTNNCSGAQVRVSIGECNCVRLSNVISIEGDEKFLKSNAVKMRGIVSLVVQEQRMEEQK